MGKVLRQLSRFCICKGMSFGPVFLFPDKSVVDVLFSYPDMHSFNLAIHAPVEIIISFEKTVSTQEHALILRTAFP